MGLGTYFSCGRGRGNLHYSKGNVTMNGEQPFEPQPSYGPPVQPQQPVQPLQPIQPFPQQPIPQSTSFQPVMPQPATAQFASIPVRTNKPFPWVSLVSIVAAVIILLLAGGLLALVLLTMK